MSGFYSHSPVRQGGLKFQDVSEDTGGLVAYQVFCFTPTLHKAKADFKVSKENIVKLGNQSVFLTGDWEH